MPSPWMILSHAVEVACEFSGDNATVQFLELLRHGDIQARAEFVREYGLISFKWPVGDPASTGLSVAAGVSHNAACLRDHCQLFGSSLSIGSHWLSFGEYHGVVIRSRDHITFGDRGDSYTPRCREILYPPFWQSAYVNFDDSIAVSEEIPNLRRQEAEGITVSREDVERLWSSRSNESGQAVPTQRKTSKRKAGRKPGSVWEDALIAAARIIHDKGLPPSQNQLVSEVLEWFQNKPPGWFLERAPDWPSWSEVEAGSHHTKGPSETQTKEHMAPLYQAMQKRVDWEAALIEAAAFAFDKWFVKADDLIDHVAEWFGKDAPPKQVIARRIGPLYEAMHASSEAHTETRSAPRRSEFR